LHSPVPVLLACLVCNNFIAVELQNSAGRTLASRRVVEGRHTALRCKQACAQGRGMRFTFESRGGCAIECGFAGLVGETVGSWGVGRLYGSDRSVCDGGS
jgi:hypothetical protein